jgi:dUTP pyrophosphatase
MSDAIDPGYTDEIKVVLLNTDQKRAFVIRPGYRIAQLIISPYIS